MRLLLYIFLMGSLTWPYGSQVLPGDQLVIVNKNTNELALIDNGKVVLKTKVATGKKNDLTPEGLFTILVKAENPYYRKKNIQGGDPRNPLGSHWIGFDARGTDGRIYGLHGTNVPSSIGKYVSDGCVRLHAEPLKTLYDQIQTGMKVLIVNSDKPLELLAAESGAI